MLTNITQNPDIKSDCHSPGHYGCDCHFPGHYGWASANLQL